MKCFAVMLAGLLVAPVAPVAGAQAPPGPGDSVLTLIDGTTVVLRRAAVVYTLADGRKVVVEESADRPAPVAVPAPGPARQHVPCEVRPPAAPAACPKCGPACDCGPACQCTADAWVSTCKAIPAATRAVYAAPVPPPSYSLPTVVMSAPVYYPAPVYGAPVCTTAAFGQATGAGFEFRGPFGGRFGAGFGLGADCGPGG